MKRLVQVVHTILEVLGGKQIGLFVPDTVVWAKLVHGPAVVARVVCKRLWLQNETSTLSIRGVG